MLVSLFSDFSKVINNIEFTEVVLGIKSGQFNRVDLKKKVETLRGYLANDKKSLYDQDKSGLMAFTACGTFNNTRANANLDIYSHHVIIDIDHIPSTQVETLKQTAATNEYTKCVFISPSGLGLKILVSVDTDVEEHHIAHAQVAQHYINLLNIKVDKGDDLARLCFLSYDPQIYYNPNAETFKVTLDEETKVVHEKTRSNNLAFEKCVAFTNQKSTFEEGNRNNYIYQLACNCNRSGIQKEVAEELIQNNFNLNQKEIESCVKSAYQKHLGEHGTFKPALYSSEPKQVSSKLETPLYPEDIFADLPDVLKQGSEVFTDKRERDVFFTGALIVLSGCLPNVQSTYSRDRIYPNLFGFIVAKAASGKGALKYARQLGMTYHKSLLKKSEEERKEYEVKLAAYKKLLKSEPETAGDPPEEPSFKLLFIPGNTSSPAVIKHLMNNDGKGIMCETEADTVGTVIKNDWGNYSDLLRKAFHHEPITYSRKTNNEYAEVEQPQLSLALAGTPGQVTGLIASSEDGLFSRIIFYLFEAQQAWRDVSPLGGGVNFTDHFEGLSSEVYQMVQMLTLSPTTIELQPGQWMLINTSFAKLLDQNTKLFGVDTQAVVKRLGLIQVRICMILSALRKYDTAVNDSTIMCSDTDFEIAQKICAVIIEHAMIMFENLPKQDGNPQIKGNANQRQFWQALPNKFQRKEAIQIANSIGISKRSADAYLKKWQPSLITLVSHGNYSKVE